MELCSLGSRRLDKNILSFSKYYLFEDTSIILKNILDIKYLVEKDYTSSTNYDNDLIKAYNILKIPVCNSNLFKLSKGLLNEGKYEINYFFQHLKTIKMKYQNIIVLLLSDVETKSERKTVLQFLPCVEDVELCNYRNLIVNSYSLTFHNQTVKSIQFQINNTITWNEICKIKQIENGEYYLLFIIIVSIFNQSRTIIQMTL